MQFMKNILFSIFALSLLPLSKSLPQSYNLILQNSVFESSSEFRFDIFISNYSEYAKAEYVIKFPSATSSNLTFGFVQDCSELLYYQIPDELRYDTLTKTLVVPPRAAPGPGHGTISQTYGDRVARIKINFSNSSDISNIVSMQWQNSGAVRTRIYSYLDSILTEITDSAAHTKDFEPPLGFSAPYVPLLVRPYNNSVISSFPLYLFSFYPSTTIMYRVQLSTDSLFVNRALDSFYNPGSSFPYDSFRINTLDPDTRYYWRVNVHNFYAISPFSAVWNFVTDNLTNINLSKSEEPVNFFLSQNYPNPFNPSTVISYHLPVNSKVSLKVYDILGNESAVLVDENKNAGSHEVRFEGNNFSNGIYFYRLEADGNIIDTKRMVLLK